MFQTTPRIELISIHIPKTAGTSFRNVLRSVYGRNRVLRVDMPLQSERVSHEKLVHGPKRLPGSARVLHGHFCRQDLVRHYGLGSGIPVITWLRDPVERVLSNYFYLQKILRGIVDERKRNVALLNKMEKTLLEYARAEIARNRMAKFLNGMDLRDFLFAGIQEFFWEDLTELAGLLHWKRLKRIHDNSSEDQKAPVSEEIRGEIRRLNDRDVELYEEALRLRVERRETVEVKV